MEKENLEKKIKEREKASNIVMNKITMVKNTKQKDILQDREKHTSIISDKNTLTRDYRKERAEAKAQAIENLKNQMRIPKSAKKAQDSYEAMNNRLINKSLNPGH